MKDEARLPARRVCADPIFRPIPRRRSFLRIFHYSGFNVLAFILPPSSFLLVMKPTIVLVGRPNVGKSTLFNRMPRAHQAMAADIPGPTRDRLYGHVNRGGRPFLLIDNSG